MTVCEKAGDWFSRRHCFLLGRTFRQLTVSILQPAVWWCEWTFIEKLNFFQKAALFLWGGICVMAVSVTGTWPQESLHAPSLLSLLLTVQKKRHCTRHSQLWLCDLHLPPAPFVDCHSKAVRESLYETEHLIGLGT